MNPTNFFKILELKNPSNDALELHNVHRSPVLKALKLRKGRSGLASSSIPFLFLCPEIFIGDKINNASTLLQSPCQLAMPWDERKMERVGVAGT